jgi:hypothetical protein
VERVAVDDTGREAWLQLRPGADRRAIAHEARAVAEPYKVQLSTDAEATQPERERVRFVDLIREAQRDGLIRYDVVIEWLGAEHRGTAVGEFGDAVELRTAASASLAAIAAVIGAEFSIRMAGVKQIRAFDAEIVIVSLYQPAAEQRSLVGAVVAGEDTRRAAALAVFSALNRLLVNYLPQ